MSIYILDTNALSEFYLSAPDRGFMRWFDNQPAENLYTTSLNAAEIRYGIDWLPESKKKTTLEIWWNNFLMQNFRNRLFDFDLNAARAWGKIYATDRRNGTSRPTIDSLVAAIAIARNIGVITRNTHDFAGLDIDIINPWD